MADIFHDTLFAYALRSVVGTRTLTHPEEKDPSSWPEMVHTEKKQDVNVEVRARDDVETIMGSADPRPSTPAQSTHSSHTQIATPEGAKDAEQANEAILVDWYGPDDPAVGRRPHVVCQIF